MGHGPAHTCALCDFLVAENSIELVKHGCDGEPMPHVEQRLRQVLGCCHFWGHRSDYS